MNQAIAYLNDLGIDTTSRVRAIQTANEMKFDGEGYRRMIAELTGETPTTDDNHARYTFLYLVQDIVTGQKTDSIDQASIKAAKYLKENPWVVAKPETTSYYEPKTTVDALGQPKQKKGAKKEAAIKFYKENKDKFTTRKEWIAALAQNIGLTEAAASTYKIS